MLPPTKTRKIVLVVEDSPDLADLIRTAIASEAGYYTLVASDATHALRYLHSVRPHLVVLDVYLPNISGIDLYDIMRRNEFLQDIPVLFLTAATDDQEFQARHFQNVLPKPFKLDSLLNKVIELCS